MTQPTRVGKGSTTQISVKGIRALPVRGGAGLNPCPDGLGQLFWDHFRTLVSFETKSWIGDLIGPPDRDKKT